MRNTRLNLLRKQQGLPVPFVLIPFEKETRMIHSSRARVPTAHASRYLQQLCKHWSHNLAVEFDAAKGNVTFPRNARGADWPGDAKLALVADDQALDCRLDASSEGQLEALKGAVSRHVDRFAFREAPLVFDWQDEKV